MDEKDEKRKINWTKPPREGLAINRDFGYTPTPDEKRKNAEIYKKLKEKESGIAVCVRNTVRRITAEEEYSGEKPKLKKYK